MTIKLIYQKRRLNMSFELEEVIELIKFLARIEKKLGL
jgi:hypothetical protein